MSQDPNLEIIQGNSPARNLNRLHNMEENIKAVSVTNPPILMMAVNILMSYASANFLML